MERLDLTNFAATVAKCMGIEKDAHMSPAADELVKQLVARAGGTIEKAVFLHCDAVPSYIVAKNEAIFAPVRKHTQYDVPFHAVMPSITPVCFAAMFSGTYPDRNGVPEYVKPMITEEVVQPSICTTTLIDLLVKAGKRVAVVTCANGCIASMLYNRGEDLHIIPGDDDAKMFEEACGILERDECDALFLYQLSFDYTMHAYGPEDPRALDVLTQITGRYDRLVSLAREKWSGSRMMTAFNADHGAHLNEKGRGSHGADIPEDMDMTWFFGAYSKN